MNNNRGGSVKFPAVLTKPSILHGWRFLQVFEENDDEALIIKPVVTDEGPSIAINPELLSVEALESPETARIWLPLSLHHICHVVLQECLDAKDIFGRFTSDRWKEFFKVAEANTSMEWSEILSIAKREGVHYMSDYVASCLFVESGIQDKILARLSGARRLKIA